MWRRTNWIEGQEVYAKGFIDCFYAYHGLGPAEAHWPYQQFQQFDPELMMRHLFEEGHVDVAIFQPTYLTQWYKEGFNTTERNATVAEQHPERFVLNGAFDLGRRRRPRGAGGEGRALRPQRREGVHG